MKKRKGSHSTHMLGEWDRELQAIRQSVLEGDNILSKHTLKRLEERRINIADLARVILTGEIVEAYDIGDYPGYRNNDLLRNVIGKDKEGNWMKVGVSIKYVGSEVIVENITTCFLLKDFQVNELLA
jgi:predicted RNA-binding protein with EMAP domain